MLLAFGFTATSYAQTASQATQDVRLGTVASPMRIGSGVKPPSMIHQVDPDLKPTEEEKKQIGEIFIGFVVDEQGVPQNVHVIRCTHQDLCHAAMEAVRQDRFKPAMYQGRPVAVELSMNVNVDVF
jgi:protein TonB